MTRLFLLLLAFSQLAFTQTFTYKAINIPGATETQVRGVNSSGEIVGLQNHGLRGDQHSIPQLPRSRLQNRQWGNHKTVGSTFNVDGHHGRERLRRSGRLRCY